ncbi:MAG: O-antigen ligase family protein [Minisyncoccia bacterium]
MKFSLERINKNILLIGLMLLLFRNSSFAQTGIPQPFEIIFIIVSLLTLVDLIVNNKWKEFFTSISKKLWIAIYILLGSILGGWLIAVFVRNIPTTTNTVHEFGAFLAAATSGILILYYSRNDHLYIKKCVYALSVPGIYILAVLVPEAAYSLHLAQDGAFHGFTNNVHIASKTLLIPLFLCIAYSLISSDKYWRRVLCIIGAILLTALIFWTVQRAALLAVIVGAFIVWVAVAYRDRNWKKTILNAVLLILILMLGFFSVPHEGKKAATNRVLNFDGDQMPQVELKDKSLIEVIKNSIQKKKDTTPATTIASLSDEKKSPEPRFQIWGHYLPIVFNNPLGLGPNTHMDAVVVFAKGIFINPGPHNTYLTMWLWGGIIGLLSFLYLVINGFKYIYASIKKEILPVHLVILGSLVAFCITMFFNDGLQLYWFWILLALALRYETTTH